MSEPTAPIPSLDTYDEQEERAQEMAAEIMDAMSHLGKVLKVLEKKGFSEETKNRFARLTRQTYQSMVRDLPNLFREGLQEAIEADFSERTGGK